MSGIENWFRCPECHEKDNLTVRQALGFGNFSIDFDCKCGFRHTERDPSSDNWRSSIRLKQFLTGQNIKSPSVSRTAKKLVICPHCRSEDVQFWVYSDNPGLENGKTTGHVRLDCRSCDANETTSVEHN